MSCWAAAFALLLLVLVCGAAAQAAPSPSPPPAPGTEPPVVFLPEYDGLGVPAHPAALAWLRRYFETSYGAWGAGWNRTEWAPAPRTAPCGSSGGGGRGGGRADQSQGGAAGAEKRQLRPRREYLLLSPVGDGWTPDRWLAHATEAEFDLAVIYIGSDPAFSCPQCAHVFLPAGTGGIKWQLLRDLALGPAWGGVAGRYKYLMYADDDLVMDTCGINAFFRTMEEHSLLLAQPSLCAGSVSWWRDMLTQRPGLLLRHTTFVEIMAPAWEMGFFTDVIRHALFNTNFGYGSDNLWPALLWFPRRGLAVVDYMCMAHPPRRPGQPGAGSIYAAPTSLPPAWEEHPRTLATFNLTQGFLDRHGGHPRVLSEVRLIGGGKDSPTPTHLPHRAAMAMPSQARRPQPASGGGRAGVPRGRPAPWPVSRTGMLAWAAAVLGVLGVMASLPVVFSTSWRRR